MFVDCYVMFGFLCLLLCVSVWVFFCVLFDLMFVKVFELCWCWFDILCGVWCWCDDLWFVLLWYVKLDWFDDMLFDKWCLFVVKGRWCVMWCVMWLDECVWMLDLILMSDVMRCLEMFEAMGDAVEAFRMASVILVLDFYDKMYGDEGDVL